MVKKDNIRLGKEGEALAASFLIQHGFRILERNYRCHFGEMDIIAVDGDTLVFIEVKIRQNFIFGLPQEAVTSTKQAKLIKIADCYMKTKPESGLDKRIDVIAIYKGDKEQPSIEWIKNAIESI